MANKKKYTGENSLSILKRMIDNTFLKKKDAITFLDIYPVGSIYMSIAATNPSELFGGEWERIANGRTLIGMNESDTDFNIPEKIGGSKTKTLTTAEMPSHTHSLSSTSHNHSLGSHTHDFGAWSDYALSTHTHSIDGHSHDVSNHYHTISGHTHDYSGSISSSGGHTHKIWVDQDTYTKITNGAYTVHKNSSNKNTGGQYGVTTESGGKHTHSYSGTTDSNGQQSTHYATDVVTQSSGTMYTNSTDLEHDHYVSGTTDSSSGSTGSSSIGGSIGSTGSGNSFSLMQPYFTCYIWKRTK